MSTIATSKLFSSLRIGDITIPHRLGMPALTRNRARSTVPTEVMRDYYVQRVKGGAHLIISEGILISRQGTDWPHAPGIWNNDQVKMWKMITDAVHQAGGVIYAQLAHGGRVLHPDALEQKISGEPIWGPSAIAARGGKFRTIAGNPGHVTPTPIPDPRVFIEQFRKAAVNAKEAGFDGVELHAAFGHLVAQFLDSSSNQRTDEWGGSVENRARFGLDILREFKGIFGRNVSVKINPSGGFNDVGMPLQEALDTYRYFITEADKLDIAYFSLVRYIPQFDMEIDGKKRATPHDVIESYRPYIRNARLFVGGGITPVEAANLVDSGTVDGVFIGMLWVSHPDLVKRVELGKPLDTPVDLAILQWGKVEDMRVGYTDYPIAVY